MPIVESVYSAEKSRRERSGACLAILKVRAEVELRYCKESSQVRGLMTGVGFRGESLQTKLTLRELRKHYHDYASFLRAICPSMPSGIPILWSSPPSPGRVRLSAG